MIRQYIDWIPFERPKISNRCPPPLKESVFEQNKDLLMKYARMTDAEVSEEMIGTNNEVAK